MRYPWLNELKRARKLAAEDRYAWKPRFAVMLFEVSDQLIAAAEEVNSLPEKSESKAG